ncbi:MAG: cation diffusion facilitator family transporter [Candidatus Promineifilaceae bacterium]
MTGSRLHIQPHSHDHQELASEQAFLDNKLGNRTIWLALASLLITALIQIIIVLLSGSVALLADTFHNVGDGLNSIPLLIAFYLARRIATRRYNYGFGKAEDIAGIVIVISIVVSAGIIFWESFQKLLNPQPMTNMGWVAAAAIIGFAGNELVAFYQIRVGRQIGSAALVTDGLHARADGLTSLAVLLAAAGSWLGFPAADPIIGFTIGIAVLLVGRDALKRMWYRLMDAIEPELLAAAESAVHQQEGVKELRRIRLRWVGHRIQADIAIAVTPNLSVVEGHEIAEQMRHALFHSIPKLSEIAVHVDPWEMQTYTYHQLTDHHEAVPRAIQNN